MARITDPQLSLGEKCRRAFGLTLRKRWLTCGLAISCLFASMAAPTVQAQEQPGALTSQDSARAHRVADPQVAPTQAGDILRAFRDGAREAIPSVMPDEVPMAQTPVDHGGKMIPVTYLKGRVSSQSRRYILGPGDKIDMKVRDLGEYDQRFDIRPDGYASIHPFGEFYIAGTDLAGLERWLEEKFKFYLRKPIVTLSAPELRAAQIYVSGQVKRPGSYQFIRQGQNNSTIASELQEKMELTLTNVLKRAGGLTLFSDLAHIRVTHSESGDEETYNLLNLLVDGKGQDIWLTPGDAVRVPETQTPMSPELFRLVCRSTFSGQTFPVVVLGAVEKQGEVNVDPNNNSLNAAIALAGGFRSFSRQSRILIQRPTNQGGFSQFEIDRRHVNFDLMAGDVVYVADSKLAPIRDGLQLLSQMTQPFFFVTGAMSNVNNVMK